jgi:uracil-DNA glycosylase
MNNGTWLFLLEYLRAAELDPLDCFFTNALVGLQPLKAEGAMYAVDAFYQECRVFLKKQINIVRPRLIVALGQKAIEELNFVRTDVPSIQLMHPGALLYIKSSERGAYIVRQGTQLKIALLERTMSK